MTENAHCGAKIHAWVKIMHFKGSGAPERIRTSGLCLRRAALYPAELRVPMRPDSKVAASSQVHPTTSITPCDRSVTRVVPGKDSVLQPMCRPRPRRPCLRFAGPGGWCSLKLARVDDAIENARVRVCGLRENQGIPVVETVAKNCRMCLVEGPSIRSVARDLGLARNFVRTVVPADRALGLTADRMTPAAGLSLYPMSGFAARGLPS